MVTNYRFLNTPQPGSPSEIYFFNVISSVVGEIEVINRRRIGAIGSVDPVRDADQRRAVDVVSHSFKGPVDNRLLIIKPYDSGGLSCGKCPYIAGRQRAARIVDFVNPPVIARIIL